MKSFNEVLEKYRQESFSEHDKGSRFEVLMRNFLLTYAPYSGKFSDVWLWKDFPYKNDFGGKDLGIDIVAKNFDGEFWAVQCKCYAETSTIDKPAVDSFLATSSKIFQGDKKFSARLWISTTNNFNDNAEKTLQNQSPPVTRLGLEDLRNAAVDWEKLDAGIFGDDARKNFREPLQHQLDAINATQQYFQNNSRGKLIMACGTGKTYTSLKIAEKIFPTGNILFLVPSISLLSQTLQEWATFAENPFNYICVCSDETVSKNTDEITGVNLPMPATTDPAEISRRIENFSPDTMTVIFSTYQSVEKVADAKISFDLVICDEAHRTTGYGKDATQFTAIHSENFIDAKKRLYMTATPRLYNSDAKKKAADNDLELWSMDDAQTYGEEIFHIGFGEAVEKNLLSDYKVIVLTISENSVPAEIQNALAAEKNINVDDVAKLIGCVNALQKRSLNDFDENFTPLTKAVAFCPKITVSKQIAETFNALNMNVTAQHLDGTMSAAVRDEKCRRLPYLDQRPLFV